VVLRVGCLFNFQHVVRVTSVSVLDSLMPVITKLSFYGSTSSFTTLCGDVVCPVPQGAQFTPFLN
jgi:hypothetical protein